jgi:hypothetical protein
LECIFTISVNKRMFSLNEIWVTSDANVKVGKKIIKIEK